MLVTCLHVSFQGGSTFGLRECSWTLRNHWIFGRDCNCADSPRNNTFFFPQGKRIQEIWLGMFFSPPSVDSGLLIYQLYDLGMFFGWFSYSEWQFKVKIMLGKNVGEICWYLDYHPRLHLGWRCRMLPPKGAKGVFFGIWIGLSQNMRRDLYHCENGAIGGEGYLLILDEGFGNCNGKWTICMLTLHVILEIRMFIIYYVRLCLSTNCSTLWPANQCDSAQGRRSKKNIWPMLGISQLRWEPCALRWVHVCWIEFGRCKSIFRLMWHNLYKWTIVWIYFCL